MLYVTQEKLKEGDFMRYGFCTGFATTMTDAIDYDLLEKIKDAGYDFVEFPLMLIESLSDQEFEALLSELGRIGIDCDAVCNLFPARVRVIGPDADKAAIDSYLRKAFARASRMGVKKVVFGSSPSRQLPEGWTRQEGYRAFVSVIHEHLIPLCRAHGFHLMIEPIAADLCNLINSLDDGMEIVQMTDSPVVSLHADSVHMLSIHEDADNILKYAPFIDHIHISELDRVLPETSYTPELLKILKNIKAIQYDDTISFEPMPSQHIDKALNLIKSFFES
jgi:D-psicose/D-tagatose/L-ribulose 3-epimerase